MARYFALVNGNNIVEQVIVADQSFVDAHPQSGKRWIETSMDGSVGGNPAGIGHTFDPVEGFIAPRPLPSWVWDHAGKKWKAPVDYPTDGQLYKWSEAAQRWILQPDAANGL